MSSKAPFAAGARIGYMPNGYSLVPAVVVRVEQTRSGNWRGDVLTEDGLLENRSLHQDWTLKERDLTEKTKSEWQPVWERLEKVSV